MNSGSYIKRRTLPTDILNGKYPRLITGRYPTDRNPISVDLSSVTQREIALPRFIDRTSVSLRTSAGLGQY